MRTSAKLIVWAVLPTCLLGSISASTARAEEVVYLLSRLTAPVEAIFQRKNPLAPKDDAVEQLAKQIDWLEHHIDTYGTVVGKQPDVWGEARLMRHRDEFEREMKDELGKFTPKLNAALARSDQAYLGMAMALQAALPGATGIPQAKGGLTGTTNVYSTVAGLIPAATTPQGGTAKAPITGTEPFGLMGKVELAEDQAAFTFPGGTTLSLEPTIELDQRARYLYHLQELRRINEGDDTADSPGYSLNLVRIPVSVLPGKRTRKGFGAEITLTATPYLGRDLLPMTFRNLVINDLVDQLAYPMTRVINSHDCLLQEYLDDLAQYHFDKDSDLYEFFENGEELTMTDAAEAKPLEGRNLSSKATPAFAQYVENIPEESRLRIKESLSREMLSFAIPASRSRRARQPLPPSQLLAMYDMQLMAHVAADAKRGLQTHPVNRCAFHLMDVRAFLQEELQAAYEFLATPREIDLWAWSNSALASAVRHRNVDEVRRIRDQFLMAVCMHPEYRFWEGNTTLALAWAILVESALLNERLTQDINEVSSAKGCCIGPVEGLRFHLPNPHDHEREVFNEYVLCRWPIHVFALDPVTQEQNIADAFARRRELQIALALAFASGEIEAQTMMKAARRLEWDMATIALNRTAVGFSHGEDTFGWRFFPRFQTPPIKGNLAAFGETLFGGPTRDQDMRQRELETGMRECVAIVIMPSFVPYVTFDTRTNWFRLTNPKVTEISMHDTVQLSRSIKCMQQLAYQAADLCNLYRDGEVNRLLMRVRQLDRELPLQTMLVQVPHENTLGGFEMFNRGITDLAPELIGWYGAPGINRNGITTLFLVGDGFSVHDTRVIAGGRPVRFRLISRQVMEVEIPPGIQALDDPLGDQSKSKDRKKPKCPETRKVVDVHLATPYGISSHLLIPLAEVEALFPEALQKLAWQPGEYRVTFTHDTKSKDNPFTAGAGAASLQGGHLSIFAPKTDKPFTNAALEATVRYRDASDDIFVGSFPIEGVPFDHGSKRYVLIGQQLGDFLKGVNDRVIAYLEKRVGVGGLVPPTFQVAVFGVIHEKDDPKKRETVPGYLTVEVAVIEKLPPVAKTEAASQASHDNVLRRSPLDSPGPAAAASAAQNMLRFAAHPRRNPTPGRDRN